MTWKQVSPNRWVLVKDGFSGTAVLNETNSGFIASVHVENTDFDLDLVDDRDFFERREDAEAFLDRRMQDGSY